MEIRWWVAALFASALFGAGPADLTGDWILDVDKSDWGTRPPPVSVTLHIKHVEPSLQYSGVVVYPTDNARPFAFRGALDGKPYHMDRSFASGTVVLRRIDAVTIETVFRGSDGTSVETTRLTLTPDGNTLRRRIHLESKGIKSVSTEVYHRK